MMGEIVPRNDLVDRTKAFALAIIRLVKAFRREPVADVIGRQLLRSATSVAANYRSARRARSRKDFIAKMSIVEEEADESQFWLELAADAGLFDIDRIAPLRTEAGELTAITVASIRTARRSPRDVPRSAFRVPRSGTSTDVH
jgi:four helix bundle protein